MKKSINVIAGLLLIIWAVVFLGFDGHRTIHALPVLACLIILVNTFYKKKITL